MEPAADLAGYRQKVVAFLEESIASGMACPTFGVIMPPDVVDAARRWQQHCFANGYAGVDWAVEHGGQGLTGAHELAWSEECARHGLAAYMNFQGFILAGGAIRKFGTPEQQAQYLSATLSADILWCQLFSEPNAGSDLVSLMTRAEPTGDGWRVTGQKVWSSTAQLATHAILLARTNLEEPGHRGISFFLLDMTRPGIEVRPIKQMTGDHEFCEVFMDDVELKAEDLLGELNMGWTVATSVLADERASVGATGIRLKRRMENLAEAPDHRPAMRPAFADHQVAGSTAGLLLSRTGGNPMLGPLSKLALTELESSLAAWEVHALGPAGMLESDAATQFLYAPGMRVAGGTSEIQRNLVGERLLGLPREPRAT